MIGGQGSKRRQGQKEPQKGFLSFFGPESSILNAAYLFDFKVSSGHSFRFGTATMRNTIRVFFGEKIKFFQKWKFFKFFDFFTFWGFSGVAGPNLKETQDETSILARYRQLNFKKAPKIRFLTTNFNLL
jgi:hypothetical protein